MKAFDGYERVSRPICRACADVFGVLRRGLDESDREQPCATCFGGSAFVSLPMETLERLTAIHSDVAFAKFAANQIEELGTLEEKAARVCSLMASRDRHLGEFFELNYA